MPSATPVRAVMRTVKTTFGRHPQFRYASTLQRVQHHQHDNLQAARKIGRTAIVYFPFYALAFGWPVSLIDMLASVS